MSKFFGMMKGTVMNKFKSGVNSLVSTKYWLTSAQGLVVLVILVVICILAPIVFPLFIIGKIAQHVLPEDTFKGSAEEACQRRTSNFHKELYVSVKELLIDNQGFRRIVAEDLLNRIHNRRTAIETKG